MTKVLHGQHAEKDQEGATEETFGNIAGDVVPTGRQVAHSWLDQDGFHVFGPGHGPTAEEYEEMTRAYREKIRNSPLWKLMVKEYGKKKAEEILLECKVKPG